MFGFRGVVEHAVYVAEHTRGHGLWRQLLDAIITAYDDTGIWTIQSSIFRENTASVHLHEQAGFRQVGYRERVALMPYGPWTRKWCDTILIDGARVDGQLAAPSSCFAQLPGTCVVLSRPAGCWTTAEERWAERK